MSVCVVCGFLVDEGTAHDFHGPDCTWPDLECCTCDGRVCPACCPFCEKEKTG